MKPFVIYKVGKGVLAEGENFMEAYNKLLKKYPDIEDDPNFCIWECSLSKRLKGDLVSGLRTTVAERFRDKKLLEPADLKQ